MVSLSERLGYVRALSSQLFRGDDHSPRVASAHVESMVRRFRRRSKRWLGCALIEAIAAFIVIAGGAYIFVNADYFARQVVFSKEEVLKKEADVLRVQLAKLQTSVYDLQTSLAILKDQEEFSKTFASLNGFLEFVLRTPSESNSLIPLKTHSAQALEKIKLYSDPAAQKSGSHGAGRLSTDPKLLEAIEGRGIKLDVPGWESLASLVRGFPSGQSLDEKQVVALREARARIQSELASLVTWHKEVVEQGKDLASQLRELEKKGTLQEAERTRSLIDAKNQELVQLMESRANLLKDLWIPDLTVRIGAVVLLVFLTQLLVSLMRYHISLSSFYASRADALQLVNCHRIDSDDFDSSQLTMLVNYFTPGLSVDAIPSPVSQLADLVRSLPRP
jgi:hypothetical protein